MQYSIIDYKNLEAGTRRLDAEYYKPDNLILLDILSSKPLAALSEIAEVLDGFHSQINYAGNEGIRLITAQSPKDNYIDIENLSRISLQQNEYNVRTQLLTGDVIISTIGTIGNCAVITENMLPLNACRNVGIIRPNDDYLANYISIFLQSKYGRFQTLRESTGNVQLALFIYKMAELAIPLLTYQMQLAIDMLCVSANDYKESSKKLIKDTESMLLSELGLDNWQPQHQLCFTGSYKDTASSYRIDAEYYQPKYEELASLLKSYSRGWKCCSETIQMNNKNVIPELKKEYRYLELSNIGNIGEILDCSIEFGVELPSRARRQVKTGEVLISSVEGSLDKVALIDDEYNDALCSTGFHIVSSKEINSETLLVFFKSMAGYMQLKKGCTGTILTAINQSEFAKIIIPLIREEIQEEIKQKVTESQAKLKEAKRLIEVAKRSVEIAIEESEEKAMEYIKDSL